MVALRQRMLLVACALSLSLFHIDIKGLAYNKVSTGKNYAQHFKTKIASSEAKCERRRKEREKCVSREKCSHCNRPPILCVCEALPKQKVSTMTNVLVLQHPNEYKRKSLSTVPLMPLVLENCTVKVGYNFEPESLDLVKKYLDKGKKPLLLFPGSDAISLDDNDVQCGNNKVMTNFLNDEQLLILIDGTWAEARRMLIQSPELVELCQQVQFSLTYDSIYDVVRKEPEKHCISTLEACAESLTLLEPDKDVAQDAKSTLLGAMKHMVDIKRKIYKMRNPEPRFVKPGMRQAKKLEKSKEIENAMFGKD
jgi:DTW domain-containing protein YfiP